MRSALPRRARSSLTICSASLQGTDSGGFVSSLAVALFFINTDDGQAATAAGLDARGIATLGEDPPAPWHRVRGSDDATTMWYAVLRKSMRGVVLGSLVFRHSDHHALLIEQGWEEIPVDEILGR